MISSDASRIATSRPSMEKILVSSALLIDGVVGGIFSLLWMMMPPGGQLSTELVALVIDVGSRRREESSPVVQMYAGGGGGETNDGDDRGRYGVIAVVATTVLISKTFSGDNGEELLGFEILV